MFEKNLILKYLPVKDSFLYVNTNLKCLKTGTCVQLTDSENNTYYFSIGQCSVELEDNYIGISSLFAKALGIENNLLFRITEVIPFSSVESLTIFPVNQNEYEVMEMLSDNIQETLLNQIRVVYTGQKFIIWIGNNITVTVCVGNIIPVSPGAINFLTEVHIEPVTKSNLAVDPIIKDNRPNNLSNQGHFNFFDHMAGNNDNLKQYLKPTSNLIFRIVPLSRLPSKDDFMKEVQSFTVFLSKKQSIDFIEKYSPASIFSISLLTHDVFAKEAYVKLVFIEEIQGFELDLHNELYVGQEILDLFDIQMGARVILKAVVKHPIVREIQINSRQHYSTDVINTLRQYLANGSDHTFVLNSNIPMDIGENVICSLKFFPDEPKFCVVDDNLVRNCKYVLNIENVMKESNRKEEKLSGYFFENISNHSEIIRDVTNKFSDEIEENCLILGKSGTGKSTVLKEIANKLQSYNHFIYVKYVNCKSIKGKTMESLNKFFTNTFSELLLHEPSVLILDDLHILCENIQGDEVAPNNIYFCRFIFVPLSHNCQFYLHKSSFRISEMLHNFLKLFFSTNKIGILASSETVDKLNKNIHSSRGSHLFKNIYTINALSKLDRISVLKTLFKDFDCEEVNLNDFSVKLEGFVMVDLIDFANKTKFELYKHEFDDQKSLLIRPEYLEKAFKNTSVISLQNVQLHSPGDKDFSNVGGLHNIKKILIENLFWPGQFPNIFENAPLRLQSGLLLYGPPGSGKTVLVAAAAKQCGMRLISVKGPELLSKYIGASEQAVRDIFQKAQSAKPCILFFDEFDSLAPKRGHDNTGVTDRVVNQLLTQLDGVESLTGVCVLAATSRPDLLDSALLRPGRLDKQLLCPLPDEVERLEILKILSKNLYLEAGVTLEKLAKNTEHFSGADLQSLLYTSHMLTIDDSLGKDKGSTFNCEISQDHLEEALLKTKPSLSSKERLKYEKIYAKFQRGSTLEDFETGSRATLA